MHLFIASVRLTLVTIGLCAVAYTAVVLGLAKALIPEAARGSLVAVHGKIVGSRLVAQKFTRPDYFWPRPSAVDYNGAGAGGSNLSPTSTTLTDRAKQTVEKYGADIAHPLPAELAAASGSGLLPEYVDIPIGVPPGTPPREHARRKPPVRLLDDDVRKLRRVIAADASLKGRRDMALVDLLLFRRVGDTELAALKKSDVDLLHGEILLPRPRGGYGRRLPLNRSAFTSLKAWLRAHPDQKDPYVFPHLGPSRGTQQRPISIGSINRILKRRGIEAATAATVSTRTLRLAETEALRQELLQALSRISSRSK